MSHATIALTLVLLAAPALASTTVDQGEAAAGSPDKVVCKRFVETGSLVKGYRTCKSKREWERERENLRANFAADSCRGRGEPDAGACGGN